MLFERQALSSNVKRVVRDERSKEGAGLCAVARHVWFGSSVHLR
jgi:hypothetical protein